MNAAAREINQSNIFNGHLRDMRISKFNCLQLALLLAVLLSALAVVYVSNLHRLTLSRLQVAEQHMHDLELNWGQLILEQASLATPARVQQLATEKLHMLLPANTIFLRVK